jgi:hypothetical protein
VTTALLRQLLKLPNKLWLPACFGTPTSAALAAAQREDKHPDCAVSACYAALTNATQQQVQLHRTRLHQHRCMQLRSSADSLRQ